MTEHENTPTQKAKLFRRPLFWLGLVTGILLLAVVSIMSIHAIASTMHTSQSNLLVVITNSGSTNTPAATLTINHDGSGSITYHRFGDSRFNTYSDRTFPPGTFQVTRLATMLVQMGDVSTIPDRHCLKSVSFGSTTTITFQGKTSGDVSCITHSDPQLCQDVSMQVQEIYSQAIRSR